jgi:chemotaxis protein methyltransferase CheR
VKPAPYAGWMDQVSEAVLQLTGLHFPPSRADDLERGVCRAMDAAGVHDPARFLGLLRTDPLLLDGVVAEITVGESYFFRDPAQLEVIRRRILPSLRERGPDVTLRAWSAGCASGAEPYTLGMLLHEEGMLAGARILATDISRPALARALAARYTKWSLRATSPDRRARYFQKTGGDWEVVPEIRRRVTFGYLNLATDTYPTLAGGAWGMDLILCRNVLIYFRRDAIRPVVEHLARCLAPGGWLVMGAADPPAPDDLTLDVVSTDAGLAYRNAGGTGGSGDVRSGPAATPPLVPAPEPLGADAGPGAAPIIVGTGGPALPGVATPDTARGWASRVRDFASQGQVDEAGRHCARGLELHPADAELLCLRAYLLGASGSTQEAAQCARRALYVDRNLAVGHLILGSCLHRLGDRAGARRSFRNALALLDAMDPEEVVPASDGDGAAHLATLARVHLELLDAAS